MRNIIAIILLLTLISCGIGRFVIEGDDFRYIPYKKNDILIFKSDQNSMDTIFIKGFKWIDCDNPERIVGDNCNGNQTICIKTDPNYNRYTKDRYLVQLVAIKKEHQKYISFEITLKNAAFYGLKSSYTFSEFDNIPITELKIDDKTYTDVKVFEGDPSNRQREIYVERFYWSVTEGFLGLDKKNEKWRLVKKYNLAQPRSHELGIIQTKQY